MMRHPVVLLALSAVALAACRTPYPAPEPTTTSVRARTSDWGRTDSGDAASIRRAEAQCLAGLSPQAVSAAFRAVDNVAEALLDLCSIELVADDPLVWHVWCGSDALFASGHFQRSDAEGVQCGSHQAPSAFACIGEILAENLMSQTMRSQVEGIEIVAIGSVDEQRLSSESAFLVDPCVALQRELGLSTELSWAASEEPPTDEERAGLWNERLSWCRAATSARELRRGMSSAVGGRYTLAALGAGAEWLRRYRRDHRRACPSSVESGQGACREARRVDLFVRAQVREAQVSARRCEPPADLAGGENARALYCYADCQARAAIGRNTEGYRAPRARADLLFGGEPRSISGWIGSRGSNGRAVNLESVRTLLMDARVR